MKKRKILLIVLFVIVLFVLLGGIFGMRYFNNMWFKDRPSYLTFTTDYKPIELTWSETTYGDYIEKKDAILVRIKLAGIPNKLFLQLDTGAPNTMIYGNSLHSLKELGVDVNIVNRDEKEYLEKINTTLGGSAIKFEMVRVYDDYGEPFNKQDTVSSITIGILGADLFTKYITEVDFKNQLIQFHDKREAWMTSESDFTSFSFKGRRFMLPCNMNNKECELFYDSGSSAFGLITTMSRYKKYATDHSKEVFYDANMWGDGISIRHNATDISMRMGGIDLPLKRVSYVDMYSKYQDIMTPFTTIGGWLGNKPFEDYSLIFDTAKEEFIVVEK